MDITKEHGNTGNKNAKKHEIDVLKSFLTVRCRRESKGLWVRAAKEKNMTLSEWVIENLNNNSGASCRAD
tara:strand:- start:786 stop:995 length:210 start_codon:yes stop_codon:yes gene_type:complete